MGLRLALMISVCAVASLGAATSPIDELGRVSHWFLTFVNDPYDTNVTEILQLRPELAARALQLGITFPADGDEAERKLLERFSKTRPKELPKSLRKYLDARFKEWRKQEKLNDLKLEIVEAVPLVPLGEARVKGEKLLLPVATVGRDLLRTVRDDNGLFKNFMWILSHPTYATTRPSRTDARFELTGHCSIDPLKPKPEQTRCGGREFYDSRKPDVASAVTRLEAQFAARLQRTFNEAVAK